MQKPTNFVLVILFLLYACVTHADDALSTTWDARILYLPDTDEGRALALNLKDVLRFEQQIEFRAVEDSTTPKVAVPTKRLPPRYPEKMVARRISGFVEMMVVIDTQGKVAEVKVVRSSNESFETAALQALRKWRFAPASFRGVAVRSVAPYRLEFSIE